MEIGKTISHYKILEKLGEGGMGVVYKAEDTKLDRTVALKFLPKHLTFSQKDKQRFIREAKAAAALNHPNICTIHNIDEHDGKQFMVMEYVDGETLRAKIDAGHLTLETALEYAIRIAGALAEAHGKNIIHRDIKPENVMVDSEGRVKVMDFGLAKLKHDQNITQTGSTVGTLAYMAPEQIQDGNIDHRTDLYSLGILMYEMFTGNRPYKERHKAALMYSIVNTKPTPLTVINPSVPKKLEEIILKLVKKNPDERYNSAADVADTLKGCLDVPGSIADKKLSILKNLLSKNRTFIAVLIIVLAVTIFSIPDARNTFFHFFEPATSQEDIHLVVLPFANVGDNPANKPFKDGLMETLTSSLTLLQPRDVSYWVVSASEVREMGITSAAGALREFNATLAVYGSVQRLTDRIQLTLNLVETKTSHQLKSSVLSVPIDSLSRLQDEAVITLARMLEIERDTRTDLPLNAGGTTVSESYEFYLEGRGYLHDFQDIENIERAISLFEDAIDLDPQFTLAHAGLGEAYWRMYEETRNFEVTLLLFVS